MRKINVVASLVLIMATLAAWPQNARAQGKFEVVTGKAFETALPKDFYLEGNAIPTEPRNAGMLKSSSLPRVLFALIDTAGYSSQIKQKYIGMAITEGRVSVCGTSVDVGSYGFGLEKPAAPSTADAKFHLYNQAGTEVASCAAPRDATIKAAKPLQLIVSKEGSAWLILGRYKVEIKP